MVEWISVQEELPDDDLIVLITYNHDGQEVWIGVHSGDEWLLAEGVPIQGVTHWMPTPEPPTGAGREHG